MPFSILGKDRRSAFPGNNGFNRVFQGKGSTEQAISVTDMISEGPIQGLVRGGASIYLNNDSMFNSDTSAYYAEAGESISYQSPSNITSNGKLGLDANGARVGHVLNVNEFDTGFIWNTDGEIGQRFLTVKDIFVMPAGYIDSVEKVQDHGKVFTFKWVLANMSSGTKDANLYPVAANPITNADRLDGLKCSDTVINSGANGWENLIGRITIRHKEDRVADGWILEVGQDTTHGFIKARFNFRGTAWIGKADNTNDLTLSISQVFEIKSIDTSAKTITVISDLRSSAPYNVDNRPAFDFQGKDFNISASKGEAIEPKHAGSFYQFRNGEVTQEPIQGIYGVGSTSVALDPPGELHTGVSKTITFSGAQASEIDSVLLMFNYPSGLYEIFTGNGDKHNAGAGYVIQARFYYRFGIDALQADSNTTDGQLITIDGNQALGPDAADTCNKAIVAAVGQGNAPFTLVEGQKVFGHGGKYLSDVSFSHIIDLEQYQPFVKFDLIITRITSSESVTDKTNGRAHTWGNSSGKNDVHTGQNLAWKTKMENQAMQNGRCNQVFGIIKDKLTYPYTALGNVTFGSKSFDSPPTRGYECYGMKVLVPSNYTTREQAGLNADGTFKNVKDLYTGIWSGDFKPQKQYTDNPAWIFYDFISSNRYGLGEFVESLEINKYALYKIARYCDELVPDGKGGTEPRFRANFYFQKATDAYKVLKDMATNFRGMLYWMDGQLTPIIDEKKTPVYTFNRSNVLDGRFEYQSTGARTRTNQITVNWNNPDSDYKIEPLIIEDRENILKTGSLVKEDATAFGCTSEGQAIRYGRWKLWTAINQTEVVSFSSSLNSAFLAPGDIITVQDNHDFGVAFSGRVAAAQPGTSSGGQRTQTFTLDREVTKEDGTLLTLDFQNREISLLVSDSAVVVSQETPVVITTSGGDITYNRGDKIPHAHASTDSLFTFSGSDEGITAQINNSYDKDGNLIFLKYVPETRVINAVINSNWDSNTPKQVTVTYADSEHGTIDLIEEGTIWGIKDDPLSKESPKEYKILTIVEEDNEVFNFSAVEYYESKFDAIDSNFSLAIPDRLNSPDAETPPPTNLRVLRVPDFTKTGEEIIVSWDIPTEAGIYKEFELEDDTKNPPQLIRLTGTNYRIENVPQGSYVFKVCSISEQEKRSVPVSVEVIIDDFYGGIHERIKGFLKGGRISSKELIKFDNTGGTITATAGFEDPNPLVYSPTDKDSIALALPTSAKTADWSALTYKFNSSGQLRDWWGPNTETNTLRPYPFASEEAFLAVIGYDSLSPQLRLINFVQDTHLNVDYWYDQTSLNKRRYHESSDNDLGLNFGFAQGEKNDIWGSGRRNSGFNEPSIGTATLIPGTNEVHVSSAELFVTDTVWFFGNYGARVSAVEGYDTTISNGQVIYLDRTFNVVSSDIQSADNHAISAYVHTQQPEGLDSNLNGKTRYTVADASNFQVGDYVRTHSGEGNTDNSVRFKRYKKILHIFGNFIIVDSDYNNADAYSSWQTGDRLTTEITNQPFTRAELRVDPRNDFLVGRLRYSGGTPEFTYESFCNVRDDLINSRAIIAEANVAFIRYGGEETPIQLSDSGGGPLYENLTVNITALGYANPEFNITGASSVWSQLSAAPGDGNIPIDLTAFVAGSQTGTKAFQVDDGSGLIAFGDGTPLKFTVTVRDAGDPTNTSKIITKDVLIEKVKDGSIGLDGKTTRIVAGDSTILYDEEGANPVYIKHNNQNKINFDLFFNGFVDPLYRITLTEGTGSPGTLANHDWQEASSAETDSFQFDIPTTFVANTYPKVFKVEVAEKPSGWSVGTAVAASDIKATDVTSISGTKAGTGAPSISIPNRSHQYNTDKFGNIGSNATATIPNSGTEIEVLLGGIPGIYVGNTTAVGKPSGVTLESGQWYFEDITNSGSDLSIGSISIRSGTNPANSIIDIGDHTMFNLHSNNNNPTDDTEVITFLIKANINGNEKQLKGIQTLSKSIEGAEGSVIVNLHKINNNPSSPGTLPTAEYNFDTGVLSNISDSTWTQAAQSPTATNRYLWQISKRVFPPTKDTSTNASQTVTVPDSDSTDNITENWLTPVVIATFGDVGRNARAIKLIPNFQFMPKDDLTQSGADSTVTCQVDIQPSKDDAGTAIPASNWKIEFFVDKNDGNGFVSQGSGPDTPNNPYLSSNTTEFTLADGDEPVGGNDTVLLRVQLRENDDSFASVVAQDTVTITRLSEGISSNLTNYSHIEPANVLGHLTDSLATDGRITGAGGAFQVFRDGTEISIANNTQVSFEVVGGSDGGSYSTKTQNGLEFRIDEDDGNYTVRPSNGTLSGWTSDRESFEVKATFSGQDAHAPITYTYVISKSREGLAGASIATSSTTVLFTKLLTSLTDYNPSGASTQQVTFDDSITINSAIAFEAGQPGTQNGQVNVNGNIQSIGTPVISNTTGSKSITVVTTLKDNRTVAQISSDIKIIIKANVTPAGGTAKNIKIPIAVNTVINGEDGSGSNGFKTAEGYVYYNQAVASSSDAGTPGTNATYTWSDGSITGMSAGWQQSPPEMKPGQQGKYYYARYVAVEIDSNNDGTPDATSTPTFGATTLGHNFTGLVTFHSGGAFDDGGFSTDGGSSVTTIDGGHISTDSIAATKLNIGKTVAAGRSNTSRMLLLEDSLKIFEGSNLRVHLGRLTNSTE